MANRIRFVFEWVLRIKSRNCLDDDIGITQAQLNGEIYFYINKSVWKLLGFYLFSISSSSFTELRKWYKEIGRSCISNEAKPIKLKVGFQGYSLKCAMSPHVPCHKHFRINTEDFALKYAQRRRKRRWRRRSNCLAWSRSNMNDLKPQLIWKQ